MWANDTFSCFRPLASKCLEDHVFDYVSLRPFRFPAERASRNWSARLASREPSTLDHIRRLDFGNENVVDRDLSHFGRLSRLESLNLHGTKVTDRGVKAIRGPRRLRTLNLASTSITELAVETLLSLRNLRELDVSETRMTNAIAAIFGNLRKLEKLWLCSCESVDNELLASLPKAASIKEIYLTDTRVTRRAARAFERKHPEVLVVY